MDNVTGIGADKDNVLFMRAQNPIFSPELKDKMVRTLGTEDAKQTVDNMEHVICSHMILKLREIGTKIGTVLGQKISEGLGLTK